MPPIRNQMKLMPIGNVGGINGGQSGMYNPGMQQQQSVQFQPGYGGSNSGYKPVTYFSPGQSNIKTSAPTPYKSPFKQGSTISQMMDKYSSMLKPMGNFMSFEDYAAPQREVFNQFIQGTFNPEFDRFTKNPFVRNMGNKAGIANAAQMGNGAARYRDAYLQNVEQPYYNQVENIRNSTDQLIRQGYNDRMKKFYDSPVAFNNLGDLPQ